MKKRIFIGSSLESKDLAYLLQNELQEEFECVLWYEDFFSLGNHYYTDLVQKIVTFDYAIMIGGADDSVTRLSTKSEKIAPRDNIYLEYGLFSGILSPKKVLLLLHESCMVASDLLGMSLSQYKSDEQAISIARTWIEAQRRRGELRSLSRGDIGLMPTVGIAVGYYYNFLKPFLESLKKEGLDENAVLHVLVPDFVSESVSDYGQMLVFERKLKDERINGFRILIDPQSTEGLDMYDVPSTVLVLFKTVNYIFGISDVDNEDTLCAKQRALDDFYENLKALIAGSLLARRIVVLERYRSPL